MISLFFNRNDNKSNRGKAESSFNNYSRVEGIGASSMKKMGISDKFRAYSASSSISPNIKEDMSNVANDIGRIRKTIRDSRDQIKSSSGLLSDLAKDSIRDSIKTGRFSTEERDNRANEIMLSSLDGGSMDSFEDFDDDDFDDIDIGDFQYEDEDVSDKSTIEKKDINEKDKRNLAIFKNTNLIDNSGIKASEVMILSSTIETGVTNLIRINSSGFNSVAESIGYSSSVSSSAFEPIIASLQDTMADMQVILNNEVNEQDDMSHRGLTLTDMLLGNFSLSSFTSGLADNIEFTAMLPAMVIGALGEQLANPIGNISKALFKKLFERLDTDDKIGRLNKNVADLPIIMRNYLESGKLETQGGIVGKIRDSKLVKKIVGNDSISDLLLKNLFGGEFSLDGIETENTKAKSSKMYYDGESHNTLNVVIPGYLMKIDEVLSGNNLYYEYSSGKWRDSEYSKEQLDYSRIDYANQRNTRLRSLLSSTGLDNDSIKNAVNILAREQIGDLKTLEEKGNIFGNDNTYELIKEAIEKDPDRFRKYMTLTDIYSTHYANKMASVTGSELNIHNLSKLEEVNDISVSEKEEDGYDRLNKSIKDAINKLKQNKEKISSSLSDSNNGSIKDNIISKASEIIKDNGITDGGENGISEIIGKVVPTMNPVSESTSSIASMIGGMTESNDPFSPSTLVTSISSKIIELFSGNNKSKVDDIDDVKAFNIDENAMERSLESEKDEATQVNEEDLDKHGFNAIDIKDGTETIMDLFMGGGGKIAEIAASGSGIFQSIFNTVSGALSGSKLFAKISGPLGKLGGMIKGKALKSSVFKKFATSGMGKKLLGMKPASLSKVMGGGGKLTSMLKAGATAVKGKLAGTTMSSALTTATGIGKSVSGFAKGALAKAASSPMASKAVASLGKVGSKLGLKTMGKGLSKIGGKGLGKILAKLGSKAGAAIPFIGPAIFIATSLPEIVQTLKHPMEAIKHPFKTIGSFLGLTEHPGVTYEEEKKLSSSQSDIRAIDALEEQRESSIVQQEKYLKEDMEDSYFKNNLSLSEMGDESYFNNDMEVKASSIIPLGSGKKDKDTEGTDKRSRILNIFKKMLSVSPFGLFSMLSRSESRDFLDSETMKQTVKDPERASREMFANTAMGSLYELSEPGSNNTNWFSKGFKDAFDILGSALGVTSSASVSSSDSSSSSSSGPTMIGRPKTENDSSPNVAARQSTRSSDKAVAKISAPSLKEANSKTSSTSSPSNSSSNIVNKNNSNKITGNNLVGKSKLNNNEVKSSIKPTVKENSKKSPISGVIDNLNKKIDEIKPIEKDYSVNPTVRDEKSPVNDRVEKEKSSVEPTIKNEKPNIKSERNKTTLNIINRYELDDSFVERNSIMDQDFEQYLIIRDLLDVVEDIGMDVNGILEQMDNMLESLTGTTVEFEKSNIERDKSNQILDILTLETNNVDTGRQQIDENTLLRNIIPI